MDIFNFYSRLWPVHTGHELIRIGRSGDGGYLVPDCLQGIAACLSPGTGHDVALEEEIYEKFGIVSLLCDPDHERPSELNKNLFYDRLSLCGGITSDKNSITMNEWLNKHNHSHSFPLMLSMDIEGGEYDVIESLTEEDLCKFRIVTMELHGLDNLDVANRLIEKMQKFFDIVHIRPNNACKMQISIDSSIYSYYHALDITFLTKHMRKFAPMRVKSLPSPLDENHVKRGTWFVEGKDRVYEDVDYSFYNESAKRFPYEKLHTF